MCCSELARFPLPLYLHASHSCVLIIGAITLLVSPRSVVWLERLLTTGDLGQRSSFSKIYVHICQAYRYLEIQPCWFRHILVEHCRAEMNSDFRAISD